MSTRSVLRRFDLMDHPDFRAARDAYEQNQTYSEIVPNTGGKLRVVYNRVRTPSNKPLPHLEYVPNPVANELDDIVSGRIVTGPSKFARGVVRPTTNVTLTVGFRSAGNAITFTLPFSHPLVARAWRRSQLSTAHYGGPGYLPSDQAGLLAFAGPVDAAYEQTQVSGYYDVLRWGPSLHNTLWWTDANLLINPGVRVVFDTFDAPGPRQHLWWYNRRQSFDPDMLDSRYDGMTYWNTHYATVDSPPVNNRIDHRAQMVSSVPSHERRERLSMGFYNGSGWGLWEPPSSQFTVTVDTRSGDAAFRTSNSYTAAAYPANGSALKAIPIGRFITWADLESFLTSAQMTQIENLRANVPTGNNRIMLAMVTLPVGNIEAADESVYYVDRTVSLDYSLNPFVRGLESGNLRAGNTVAGFELTSEHLYVPTLDSLPMPMGTEAQMDDRLDDWPLTARVTLNGPGQQYSGFDLTIEELDLATPFTPYMTSSPGGEPPSNWRDLGRRYRAFTDAHTLARHPLMPANLLSIRAWNAQTGQQVNFARCGDYISFLDNDGPYEVYFSRTNGEEAVGFSPGNLILFPSVTLTPAELQDRFSDLSRPPSWSSVESWFEHRNIVRPYYQVTALSDLNADGKDLSPFLSEFRDGNIMLSGAGDFWASVMGSDQFPTYVKVESGGKPVSMGMVTSIQSTPYANGRSISLAPLTVSQFFDTDLDLLKRENIPSASNELQFLTQLLRRSGYPGRLYTGRPVNETDEVNFRETEFWTQTPVDGGPGFLAEEVDQIYKNSSGGSTLNELRNLLQANMLDLFDLPSGDVLAESIVPVPHKTLQEIFDQDTLHYAVDPMGRWVNDPRLNLEDVTIEMGEGFARVEVEGSTNEVSLDIRPVVAPFVQGGVEKTVFTKSMPAGHLRSSSLPEWFNRHEFPQYYPFSANYLDPTIPAARKPWLFSKMVAGSAAFVGSPKEWFARVGLTAAAGNINVTKIEGGNRRVDSKGYLEMPISGLGNAVKDPDTGETWQEYFISAFNTPEVPLNGSSTLIAGIWATASGSFWSKATFEFDTQIPQPDVGSLRVLPHLGTFDPQFAPDWFPDIEEHLSLLEARKARKAQRVQNPYVGSIGNEYAVQRFVRRNDLDVRDYANTYDAVTNGTAAASQMATWLTVREFLRSRLVRVSFAGAQHWHPNQFISIARRPEGGPGDVATVFDILMVDGPSRADAGVGNQAWVKADCVFIATLDLSNGGARYDLPVGWNGPWEPWTRPEVEAEVELLDFYWHAIRPVEDGFYDDFDTSRRLSDGSRVWDTFEGNDGLAERFWPLYGWPGWPNLSSTRRGMFHPVVGNEFHGGNSLAPFFLITPDGEPHGSDSDPPGRALAVHSPGNWGAHVVEDAAGNHYSTYYNTVRFNTADKTNVVVAGWNGIESTKWTKTAANLVADGVIGSDPVWGSSYPWTTPTGLVVSSDGSVLVVSWVDNQLTGFSTATGALLWNVTIAPLDYGDVVSWDGYMDMVLSSDGTAIYVATMRRVSEALEGVLVRLAWPSPGTAPTIAWTRQWAPGETNWPLSGLAADSNGGVIAYGLNDDFLNVPALRRYSAANELVWDFPIPSGSWFYDSAYGRIVRVGDHVLVPMRDKNSGSGITYQLRRVRVSDGVLDEVGTEFPIVYSALHVGLAQVR